MHSVSLLLAATVGAAQEDRCGQLYPAYFTSQSTTDQRTLTYGAPTALFTVSEPVISGCTPAKGYYSTGQAIAQINFTYSKMAPELLESAVSNDSSVASLYITYEAAGPASSLSARIRNLSIVPMADPGQDPGLRTARFFYDHEGRVTSVNWTSTAAKSPALHRKRSALEQLRGALSDQVPSLGFESFKYEDAQHPNLATEYRSQGVDDASSDLEATRFRWTTRGDGLITDAFATSFEAAECHGGFPCHGSCCREIASNRTDATECFAVPNCDALGGGVWHYEYRSDGRTESMNASGNVQKFSYDDSGRLTGFSQGNANILTTGYSDGQVSELTFFVIYPVFPEFWGFDAPASGEEVPELLV